MNNKLNEINELLKSIEECFEKAVGYKISKLNDKIRVRTPFLYKDNDYIELFIIYNKKDGFIYISDLGLTIDKFMVLDMDLLSIVAKNTSLLLDKEKFYLYKKFNKLNKSYSLIRKIIDFANNIQRLEALYIFLIKFNNDKPIRVNIEQNIYVKSNNTKVEKYLLKEIKKDIQKNFRKSIKGLINNNKYKLLFEQNLKQNPLKMTFTIEPK